MKKALIVFLLIALCIPCACAEEINLDALSFQQLAALRDRIQLVMMQRDEWQEVTVPQGVYKVGEDIPAGTWMIKCCPDYPDNVWMRLTAIEWGTELDEKGTGFSWTGSKGSVLIHNPNSKTYDGGVTEYLITLEVGDYVIIDDTFNKAVFSPYTGKPDLGFK